MAFRPDRAGFLDLARRGRLAFVYREVLADTDTPVSAYAKLGRGPYSFLLESVVGGDKWAAYSFVGVRPRAVVRARGSSVEVLQPRRRRGFRVTERATAEEPLRFVDDYLAKLTPAVPAGAAALLRRRGRLARLRHRAQLRAAARARSPTTSACPSSASRSPTRW